MLLVSFAVAAADDDDVLVVVVVAIIAASLVAGFPFICIPSKRNKSQKRVPILNLWKLHGITLIAIRNANFTDLFVAFV